MNEEKYNLERKEKLFEAAKIFSKKIHFFSNVLECAVFGSLVSDDIYPNDIDIYIVINNTDNIKSIAKSARQIGSIFNSWDIFILTDKFEFCGFICHRKNCPTNSIDCHVQHCVEPEHIRIFSEFKFKFEKFLISPCQILFKKNKKSFYDLWRENNNIFTIKAYEKLEPIRLKCYECGNRFIFSVAEQKIYESRGFVQPKRCEDCRENKQMDYYDEFEDDYEDL